MADDLSQMLNNFKNMLQNNSTDSSSSPTENTSSSDSSNNNNAKTPNISPEMISNLANMLKNSGLGNNSADNNTSSNSSPNIDFANIMKIKSIMENLNKNDDPRSNLLHSLKPYLRESRQKKVEQYANLFKLTQMSDIFKFGKGDSK